MNIIASEDIDLLLALDKGENDAARTLGERQRHKMISMGFIRHTRNGYVITDLGEKMAKSLQLTLY
ncbi:MAG: hypothetical protein LW714_05875 [Oxalobacteraceae bacterium]|jgi:hypothetical protein|nr:hypothetical protein [Oxalobacteraceae bacterium]